MIPNGISGGTSNSVLNPTGGHQDDAMAAQFTDDLTRLRADALAMFGWIMGAISYLGLIALVWPVTGSVAPRAAWVGMLTLAFVSTLAVVGSRRYQRAARYVFAAGVYVAAACGMLILALPEGSYLFLVPVIFASVLFNRWIALANALLSILAIALLNAWGLGVSPWSVTPLLSIAITAFAAVASWLAAHNLYTALTWLSTAYANANRNEWLARDRQAELQRVLKALDEAHYRLRRLNGLLATARDQAEEGRRIKQYFAQTISHELRTPLNLVVGFAELMGESPEFYGEPLPPAYLRDLRIIYRNARHLQGLVNDVLDLARIESAQMSLILTRVEPQELVHESVDAVRSLVESRGLTLRTQIAEDVPPIWVDATRIRQVLINLLNNAARFTPQGEVAVCVTQVEDELHFAVTDTGIGIAPDELAHIFDEFYQVDSGSNRRHEGAGLGLAISRRFVGLHGGRMWAESVVGQGSKISFALPVSHRAEETPDLTRGVVARPPQELTGDVAELPVGRDAERVLLAVTQNASALGLLSRYLPDYRVLAARDMAQAHTLARQVLPQGIIVDTGTVTLPTAEAGTLVQGWGLAQVPVITCPLPGEAPLRRRLAVDGYLIKPVARQNLWDVLRSFGDGVEQVLIVDDNRDFVRLLRQMLVNPLRPMRLSSAYGGEEALERLRLSPPDLILLDLGLPDISGAQLVSIFRDHPVWRSIPIVVVSAQDELEELEVVMGTLAVTKAGGLLPSDLIRWIGSVVGRAPSSSAANGALAPLVGSVSMPS